MAKPTRAMHMDIVDQRELRDNTYRVTIAANRKVRQPPELDLEGLSTENYSRNPVVMWAHDAVGRSPSGGLPIGRTLTITTDAGGRIVADFEFLTDDPFAQRVKNAWDKGFLRAASISWIPIESVPVDGTWRGHAGGPPGVVHRVRSGRPGRPEGVAPPTHGRVPGPGCRRGRERAGGRSRRGGRRGPGGAQDGRRGYEAGPGHAARRAGGGWVSPERSRGQGR